VFGVVEQADGEVVGGADLAQGLGGFTSIS